MSYIVPDPDLIPLGSYQGESQHCVALVKKWGAAPATSNWSRGALVKGNIHVVRGTCIAIFDASGKYANVPGKSHAAVFLSQDATALYVIDQWAGQTAQKRALKFGAQGDSNNGNLFCVIA